MLLRKAIWLSMCGAMVVVALAAIGTALSQEKVPAADEAAAPVGEEDESQPGAAAPAETGTVGAAKAPGTAEAAPIFYAGPPHPPYAAAGTPQSNRQGTSGRLALPPVGQQLQVRVGGVSPGYYTGFSKPAEDPEMAKLLEADSKMEEETKELVMSYYTAATVALKTDVRTKLEGLCNKHFDIRQERRQLEVARLEARLEQIRAAIKKRNEARDFIVRLRVSQLLGEIELDEWDLPGRATSKLGVPASPIFNRYGAEAGDPFGTSGQSVPSVPVTTPARR